MSDTPRISDAEWLVMREVWAGSSVTANDVIQALSGSQTWKPKTVKTMLNRLVKKKALGFERRGREYQYFPLVSEKTCIRAASRSFLRRVFRGAPQPMLAAFLREQELSSEEISELRRILDEKGKD